MVEVIGVAADIDDYSEAYLKQILTEVKTIALVGA
ncbi:MAG: putative CoA-binding protein, partial [Halieaceae bacterium]